jgi:hypothetical protein
MIHVSNTIHNFNIIYNEVLFFSWNLDSRITCCSSQNKWSDPTWWQWSKEVNEHEEDISETNKPMEPKLGEGWKLKANAILLLHYKFVKPKMTYNYVRAHERGGGGGNFNQKKKHW